MLLNFFDLSSLGKVALAETAFNMDIILFRLVLLNLSSFDFVLCLVGCPGLVKDRYQSLTISFDLLVALRTESILKLLSDLFWSFRAQLQSYGCVILSVDRNQLEQVFKLCTVPMTREVHLFLRVVHAP